MQLSNAECCIEIMTGAVLPQGADCIIPVERLHVTDASIEVEADYTTERFRFVHAQGSDHSANDEVLRAGIMIGPAELAIIASCGLEYVVAGRSPRVRVISTGNELVPPGQTIQPHQIRMSNGPALVAMVSQQGIGDCHHAHLVDDLDLLKVKLGQYLQDSDVLILSGGVSMGKADFVPRVLAELGVKPVFHKISQRPGKPMWFGIGPQDQAVFALPGNPVSALVCCRQYVLPALLRASGRLPGVAEFAELAEDITFEPRLTCFMPVRLCGTTDGRITAQPIPTNTSGDFTSLGGTDGYVELAREQSVFTVGSSVPLHRWDRP
jgi:molybdopterin molybdotransferase